jgi:hypothetical protein
MLGLQQHSGETVRFGTGNIRHTSCALCNMCVQVLAVECLLLTESASFLCTMHMLSGTMLKMFSAPADGLVQGELLHVGGKVLVRQHVLQVLLAGAEGVRALCVVRVRIQGFNNSGFKSSSDSIASRHSLGLQECGPCVFEGVRFALK